MPSIAPERAVQFGHFALYITGGPGLSSFVQGDSRDVNKTLVIATDVYETGLGILRQGRGSHSRIERDIVSRTIGELRALALEARREYLVKGQVTEMVGLDCRLIRERICHWRWIARLAIGFDPSSLETSGTIFFRLLWGLEYGQIAPAHRLTTPAVGRYAGLLAYHAFDRDRAWATHYDRFLREVSGLRVPLARTRSGQLVQTLHDAIAEPYRRLSGEGGLLRVMRSPELRQAVAIEGSLARLACEVTENNPIGSVRERVAASSLREVGALYFVLRDALVRGLRECHARSLLAPATAVLGGISMFVFVSLRRLPDFGQGTWSDRGAGQPA